MPDTLNTYVTIAEVTEAMKLAGFARPCRNWLLIVDSGEASEVRWFDTRGELDEAITSVKLTTDGPVVVREETQS